MCEMFSEIPLIQNLLNVVCVREAYKNFKTEKYLGVKRKAPDQCDQSRSVTKVKKTKNKS